MRRYISDILIFLVSFAIVPQVMTSVITSIAGTQNEKIIFFFSGIAFLITYIFKGKLVQNIFKPKTFLAYWIYFTLIYLIIIAIFCLAAQFII
jgi:hypothetical protein